MRTSNKRITSIQSLRAVAFLFVFLSHCDTSLFGLWGGVGVSVFFVLSGFCCVYSYWDRELGASFSESLSFTVKKISSLFLLNSAMISVAFIYELRKLIIKDKVESTVTLIVKYILEVFMAQSWIPDSSYYFALNGVSWYLSTSLFLYFTFPFILKRLKRVKRCQIAMLLGLLAYVIQICIGFGVSKWETGACIGDYFLKWVNYICPIYRLGCFFIGCCTGIVFIRFKSIGILDYNVHKSRFISCLEILALVIVFGSRYVSKFYLSSVNGDWLRRSLIFTPGSVMLVFLFAARLGVITKLLDNKVFVYLGNISPFTFLVHSQVKFYYGKFTHKYWTIGQNLWIKTICTLVISVAIAEAVRRLKNRKTQIEHPHTAARIY